MNSKLVTIGVVAVVAAMMVAVTVFGANPAFANQYIHQHQHNSQHNGGQSGGNNGANQNNQQNVNGDNRAEGNDNDF